MTYLILPSILVATALLAGALAFMPIDEAQAVHTTVQGTQLNDVPGSVATNCIANVNGNPLVATSDADFALHYLISADAGIVTSASISDATNTLLLELLDNTSISGVLYFPANAAITITDDASNPASACATIVAESGATSTVT